MTATPIDARQRIAFALDYPGLDAARPTVAAVAPHVGVMKVGLELFIKEGTGAVSFVRDAGADVFLDLKLHDIPETVARAVDVAIDLGVRYLTLHAAGGPAMLRAAAERVERAGSKLTLLAVTVLTSMDDSDLRRIGVDAAPAGQVLKLARLAAAAGVNGLVCSARELPTLRGELGPAAQIVTPGIRPAGAALGDQKRVATPASAIAAGADLLVIGRPIRDAADPAASARAICKEVEAALTTASKPPQGS